MILLLLGCRELSDAEIGRFLTANTRVLDAVQANADQVETFQSLRHGKGDGDYTYDGTIESTAFDGAIDVTGTGSSASGGTVLLWSLDLGYQDVGIEDIVMNGTIHSTISIGITDGDVTVTHVVRGPLELEGDVTGTADCAYSRTASSSQSPSYGGTVSDVDLSDL